MKMVENETLTLVNFFLFKVILRLFKGYQTDLAYVR